MTPNWRRHFARVVRETERVIMQKKHKGKFADSCPATTGGQTPGSFHAKGHRVRGTRIAHDTQKNTGELV